MMQFLCFFTPFSNNNPLKKSSVQTSIPRMASHQQQSGQAEESGNQVQMMKHEYMNKVNDAASHVSSQAQTKGEEYTDKGREAASEACNKAEAKKEEMMHSASNASEVAKDSSTVQAAQTYAIEIKDQASTLIQQTGEQMKNMAAGAAEAVKTTLGMTDNIGNAAARNTDTDSPLINPHNPNQTSSDRKD